MARECPCGYKNECPIWCGDGHEDGLCPRWEWIETYSLGEPGPRYIRGQCNHLEKMAVYSGITHDELVAWLCPDCDMQLDPGCE